jgi:hypothetical protein
MNTSRFKFPRRVRIHGGECGAVARALHHEAKNFSLPAVKEKVFFTTNERKQMSTKTTLKRIALVAVSALGFGLMSVVTAPVARADGQQELVSSIATGTAGSHRAGSFGYTDIVLNMPTTFAVGDTVVVGVGLLTCPATSTLCSVSANPTQSAFTGVTNLGGGTNGTDATGANLDITTAASGQSGSFGSIAATARRVSTSGSATATVMYTSNTGDSVGQLKLRLAFKPDVSGSYSILVSTPRTVSASSVASAYTASAADLSTTVALSTTSSATTVTLAAVTGAARSGAAPLGQIFKMTLTDSAGNATLLGSTENITLTSNDTSVYIGDATSSSQLTATSLVVARDTTGWEGNTFYFRVDNSSTTDESVTLTATGGGTLSSTVTASIGTSFTAATATAQAATVGIDSLDTTMVASTSSTSPSCASLATGNKCYVVSPADSSHKLRATITTKAAYKSYWTITDTNGKITGRTGAKYTVPVTHAAADTNAYVDTSVTATLLVTGTTATYQSFTAEYFQTANATVTVKAAAAAEDDIVVTNPTRRVAAGSTNSIVATLYDQYGTEMSNKTITVTVAGRNGATASSSLVTNADGEVSYSLTDTGTVGTTDTISFTFGSVTDTATLTYGTTTVTTLSVYTAPHVTAGVADTNIIYSDKKDIDASSKAGASATTQAVSVLAKDANGVVMSGVPVTFTIAGTGCGLLSTKGTVYTGTDGLAQTSIYAWLEGKCTVTATAGGQTVTTDAYFVQTGAAEARTITGAVSGGLVTATVKDRFGNPIKGVYVYATRTGDGYFGNGSSATSGISDEAGKVEFYLNGNSSATTVKVQLGDSSAASDEYGQSSADAGKYGTKSATQTAFTAYAAGTTTTAETGVGDTLSPAGINSATVTVAAAANAAADAANAASDAAAEAIDAANAATDAANLAAEAADAATVAAEEARDAADAATAAVEELATQVATLMAALKAQITTLANTVAKIAKKVKA